MTSADYVQELCSKLTANDPSLTDAHISLLSLSDDDEEAEEELKLFFAAVRTNVIIRTLSFVYGTLSVQSTLELVDAILGHPSLEELYFGHMIFEDFSTVAIVFKKNDKLSGLRLEYCPVSYRLNVGLRWILKENVVKALNLLGIEGGGDGDGEDDRLLDLSGALRYNTSLNELSLESHDEDSTITQDTIREIPLLLKRNHDMGTFHLEDHQISSDMVRLIMATIEHHKSLGSFALVENRIDDYTAESLVYMLENCKTLLELNLESCSFDLPGFLRLMIALAGTNVNLEKLDLSMVGGLEKERVRALRKMLETNTKLKALNLFKNDIADSGAPEIAAGLQSNHTLEELEMRDCGFGRKGTTTIADSLTANDSLKKLEFRGNEIGDTGAISIFELLVSNSSLETITMGHFGERGMKAFTTNLPQMDTVKDITFTTGTYIPETEDELVEAVEQNTTLENLAFYDCDAFPGEKKPHVDRIMKKVNYILALNRAGRKILKSPSVPRSLWPLVLGRSSSDLDAIFFFLHERADAIVGRGKKMTTAGKRKREESGQLQQARQ